MEKICSNPISFFYFIVFLVSSMIYFYLPADIIPDDLGIIGFMDDFIVIICFVFYISESFMRGFGVNVNEYHERLRNDLNGFY